MTESQLLPRSFRQRPPFPDPSPLEPIDSEQHDENNSAVTTMVMKATDNGLPDEYRDQLTDIVDSSVDMFPTFFSSGPTVDLPPLHIELKPDARPVKVRPRNYSLEQKDFMDNFGSALVRHELAYPNPTSHWASTPLLVPKPGPAKFRFNCRPSTC